MVTPTPTVAEPVIAEPVVTPMAILPAATPVIDQATLQSILARMTALEEDNKTLRATVSQNDLAAVEKAKKPMGLPVAYLKVLNGKVVVSSKSEKPQILYNPSNPEVAVGEILKARYFYMDGTDSGPIDQVEFTRTTDKIEGTILEGLKGIKDSELKEVTLHFTKLITTDEDLAKSFVMPADIKINKNFLNP